MTRWDEQLEETRLSPKEEKQFLQLLGKVGWRRTGKAIFESFWRILPMILLECAVVRYIDNQLHVLLIYREDKHYRGWHMPGGYLLRGESEDVATRRILFSEANLRMTQHTFVRHYNTRRETGYVPNHQIALLFYCEAEGEPTDGAFYPLTNIPRDTLPHHKEYLTHINTYFLKTRGKNL
jgi:ADP-ribose pyrophosphatase YjhB (NUDIX family)